MKAIVAIASIILGAGCIAGFASRRNSLTFDEPFMIAAGVRALETGDLSMTWDQPPVMFYVYGSAVYAYGATRAAAGQRGVKLPSEQGTIALPAEIASQLPRFIDTAKPLPKWGVYNRFDYAREFFFKEGNDPEALTFAARIPALLLAALLATVVGLFAWRHSGPVAALFATTIVAFLPDVLAHGAIAYNDVPMALCFFLALWATDRFVRNPSAVNGVVTGLAVGAALGVKFSAVALAPAAVILLALESLVHRRDRLWWRGIAMHTPLALAIAWVVLVIVYRGDITLALFRDGLLDKVGHAETGHGVPTRLLGSTSDSGFWYFFPVAILLKVSLPIHILGVIALVATFRKKGERPGGWQNPVRILWIGSVVFLAVLMQSTLNIGVRHALPLMPLLALLLAIGLAKVWDTHGRRVRTVIASLLVLHVASSVSHYPWFLSYVTDWVPRSKRHSVFVDSNVDWGQGLLALRDFVKDNRIDGVQLSYFGSAMPEGYDIRYHALPSWLPLPETTASAPFNWVVVSATHLHGFYLPTDLYHELRDRTPDRILGNSLYAYRLR